MAGKEGQESTYFVLGTDVGTYEENGLDLLPIGIPIELSIRLCKSVVPKVSLGIYIS